MMPPLFQSFFVTALILELTPGPNMVWLALLSATKGRRAGILATLGIFFGLALIGLTAAIGLAEIITSHPVIPAALRWIGSLYLFWLAWEAWHGTHDKAALKTSGLNHLRRGFLINLLNPKAALFYVAILPTFIVANGTVTEQAIILTLTYLMIATSIHLVIVIFASHAQQWLTEKRREKIVRRIFAVLLAIVAVWFFIKSA
ncbi:MAG: LysE family translocator [Chakrabartia sp.]